MLRHYRASYASKLYNTLRSIFTLINAIILESQAPYARSATSDDFSGQFFRILRLLYIALLFLNVT